MTDQPLPDQPPPDQPNGHAFTEPSDDGMPVTESPVDGSRTRVRVYTLDDLIACVPYLLGYQPGADLVLIAVRGRRVHAVARQELPTTLDDIDRSWRSAGWIQLAGNLVAAGADRAILIGYGPYDRVAPAADLAADALRQTPIQLLYTLRVADGHCFLLPPDAVKSGVNGDQADATAEATAEGVPVDPSASAVAAAATLAGLAPAASRADLAARLDPVTGPDREAMTTATARVVEELVDLIDATERKSTPTAPALDSAARSADPVFRDRGLACLAETRRRCRKGDPVDDQLAAWLSVLTNQPDVLAAALRESTGQQWELDLWTDLTRRAEPDFAAGPATILAANAILVGNGAIANLALDRAYQAARKNPAIVVVGQFLEAGVPIHLVAHLLSTPNTESDTKPSTGADTGPSTEPEAESGESG